MSINGPSQRYQKALMQGYVVDKAQQYAVDLLQACHEQLLQEQRNVSGLYLWGRVGRGKTWLMDLFHAGLTAPARRQHFHHFMRDVHQRLFRLNGTADPLSALARELATEVRILCLDEFFVSDIGDAMILGGLVQRLFEQGVVLVTTSNQPPAQLYADGFNRDRFLPAVAALECHLKVVALDGEQDHRLHSGEVQQRYWLHDHNASPLNEVFTRHNRGVVSSEPLHLNGRRVDTLQYDDNQVWCTYDQLCEASLAANDYIALCDRFRQVLLSGVPQLSGERREARIARGTEDAAVRVEAGDRQLPKLSARDNSVRRFIALVDECYDRGTPLWIEADVPLNQLYPEGYLRFAFRRTLSRLSEMQFKRFGGGSGVQVNAVTTAPEAKPGAAYDHHCSPQTACPETIARRHRW